MRSQLIFWNIAVLALMLLLLGIICRAITLGVILRSVDQELTQSVSMFQRPPRFGPGRPNSMGPPNPGGPPSNIGHGNAPGQPPPNNEKLPGAEHRDHHDGPGHGPRYEHGPGSPEPSKPYQAHLYTKAGLSALPDDTRAVWDVAALRKAIAGQTVFTYTTLGDETLRVISTPAFMIDSSLGAVQCAYPLKDVYRAVSGITFALLLLMPVGLAIAGLAGYFLTKRVLSHVHTLTQAASRLGQSGADFSGRLPVLGEDEFAGMASTFNGLLSSLDDAHQTQTASMEMLKRFTADASHELKTPLTIIRGRASMGLAREDLDKGTIRTLTEIELAATRMDRLVRDMLHIARFDEGGVGVERETELFLNAIFAEAANEAGAPRTRMHTDITPEHLTVHGNEAELVRLFRNLIENALRYSPEDSPIEVSASVKSDKVCIAITDHGQGIPPEHLPHLGERFYRVDASRSRPSGGTGLGLYICKSIAAAHRGSVRIESDIGEGATAIVEMPMG